MEVRRPRLQLGRVRVVGFEGEVEAAVEEGEVDDAEGIEVGDEGFEARGGEVERRGEFLGRGGALAEAVDEGRAFGGEVDEGRAVGVG